jgi:hypothetical protein
MTHWSMDVAGVKWTPSFESFQLSVESEDDVVTLELLCPRLSVIRSKGFLNGVELPADWYEARRLRRLGAVAGPGTVSSFVQTVLPYLFAVAYGRSLVVQCSQEHLRFYEVAERRYKLFTVRVLAGPVVDVEYADGQSDYVLLLTQRKEKDNANV